MNIKITDEALQKSAQEGMDEFLDCIVAAFQQAVGEELTATAMEQLSPEQTTLWGYVVLRNELCDGGFIQLIHNGYGPFFFLNPFAKAMRLWGLKDFSKLLYKARELYEEYADVLTLSYSDEEFMALYEQHPAFEDLDDQFMEQEEAITARVAFYVDEHLQDFIEII